MTRSMTGFGHFELANEEYKFIVEIKSVNHRYCDISVRLPKKLSFFEATVRNEIKKFAKRGKVDVFISYEDHTEGKSLLRYNKEMAASYVEGIDRISRDFLLANPVDAYKIARFPEVFVLEEQQMDEKTLNELLVKTVNGACEKFVESRTMEGGMLKKDLVDKLNELINLVTFIEERSPQIMKEHRDKLMLKVEELLGSTSIDETILATEMVVFADKMCVDEEVVRLRSHIIHMKETLEENDGIGRKLDFIAQEMNREANTILSKANDMEVSNHAINLKTEIEKIREQIQNIE